MNDAGGTRLIEGYPVDLIIAAAREERWYDAFAVAVAVYGAGYGCLFDDHEQSPEWDLALSAVEPELAARIRTCIKDAAATQEHVVPDPRGKDGEKLLYVARLWASMVVLNPGAELSEADFERIGECLEAATDNDQVVVIPKLIRPEDFIGASSGVICDITNSVFFNVVDDDDEDPLETLRAAVPDPGEPIVPNTYGVVAGLKFSFSRDGKPEIVSIIETHESGGGNDEHFRSLVKNAIPGIGYIDFPNSAGSAAVEISRSVTLAKAVEFIQRNGVVEDNLPVIIYPDGAILRLAVTDDEGESVAEAAIDVSGGLWDAEDAADVVMLQIPSARLARDAEGFWAAATRGATLN